MLHSPNLRGKSQDMPEMNPNESSIQARDQSIEFRDHVLLLIALSRPVVSPTALRQ